MTDFIVDPTKISFAEIRTEIQEFIASSPDADQWTQFFAASSGQITTEIASAFLANLRLDSILARRENYLQHALTRGGIVAGGQNLGYSAFRGRNALLEITFTPLLSGVLDKYAQLGTVAGFGLTLLESVVKNAGVPLTVKCVVGDVLDQTLQAQNDGLAKFRFNQKRVSEDVRIFIGNDEVEGSQDILDLLNQKFYLQSNPLGSVDAVYLNDASAPFRYVAGTNIRLEWVESRDVKFVTSQVSLNESEGTLTNVVITNLYQTPETNNSIKIKAPLENETKFTIRGRNDYSKLLLLSNPDFIAAGGRDTAVAAVVEIFALKDDLSVLSAQEKLDFVESVRITPRPFGVQPPIVIDPVPNFINVSVSLCLNAGVTGDPTVIVRQVLAPYEKVLSSPEEIQKIDFKAIEAKLVSYPLIQIARITIKGTTWALNSSYRRGSHIFPTTPNGFIYEAIEFVRYSGDVEPVWPAPIALLPPENGFTYGQTIQDNELIWVSVAKDNTAQDWVAGTVYRVGDKVKSSQADASFVVQEILHTSGANIVGVAATKTEQGVVFTADNPGTDGNSISLVFDGVDDLDTVVDLWNVNNPSNTVSHDGVGNEVLTVITVNLEGGVNPFSAEPNWPVPSNPPDPDSQSFTDDNQIVWLMVSKNGTPPVWSSDTQYEIGDAVIPTSVQAGQEDIMFQMVAITGKSGGVEPVFPTNFGDTIIDNGVVWEARTQFNPDGTSASPDSPNDNEYFLISEDVVVN